jgi:hypothetical protein
MLSPPFAASRELANEKVFEALQAVAAADGARVVVAKRSVDIVFAPRALAASSSARIASTGSLRFRRRVSEA